MPNKPTPWPTEKRRLLAAMKPHEDSTLRRVSLPRPVQTATWHRGRRPTPPPVVAPEPPSLV